MSDTTNTAATAEQDAAPDELEEQIAADAEEEGEEEGAEGAEGAEDEEEDEDEPEPAKAAKSANEVAAALRDARAAERAKKAAAPDERAAKLTPKAAPKAAPAKAAPAAPAKAAPATTKNTPAVPAGAAEGDAPAAVVPPPSRTPTPAPTSTPATEPAQVAVPAEPDVVVEVETEEPAPASFEQLIERLDAPRRALIDSHIAGLKGALTTEREANKRLEKLHRTAQVAAEEATTLKSRVTVLETDLATAESRADFFEAAVTEGVKRSNTRLIFLAATDGGFIDDQGAVSWADLREKFPDLFEAKTPAATPRPTPKASAGAGLNQAPNGHRGLNQIIREAAGRR
jgi:hypothetical protein